MTFSLYWAPCKRGLFRAWGNRSDRFRHGFVIRILWLGIVFRWSYIPCEERSFGETVTGITTGVGPRRK
jgi:hypothetical protein